MLKIKLNCFDKKTPNHNDFFFFFFFGLTHKERELLSPSGHSLNDLLEAIKSLPF